MPVNAGAEPPRSSSCEAERRKAERSLVSPWTSRDDPAMRSSEVVAEERRSGISRPASSLAARTVEAYPSTVNSPHIPVFRCSRIVQM